MHRFNSLISIMKMGWLTGLEPATTGITIPSNYYIYQ